MELWFLVIREEDFLFLLSYLPCQAWTHMGPKLALWESGKEISLRALWNYLDSLQAQQYTG